MSNVSFGWITQITARNGSKLPSLIEDNVHFIGYLGSGFNSLWFEDHLQWDQSGVFECWTMLCYFAAKFPRFFVGSLVFSQSFRNPALLAKMMASLQMLSGGRLIAGIGAGWKEDEYKAYGFKFPADRVRLEQLEEVVQILRLLWAQSPASFLGEHYSIQNAHCVPSPAPAPPLLIGGAGEAVTLRLVAQYADWMNILFADPETFSHKANVLRRHCDDLNRDYSTITRSLYGYVYLSKDGKKPKARSGNKYIIYGDASRVRDEIAQFIEAGVQHFMLRFLDFPDPEGICLFQERVISEI